MFAEYLKRLNGWRTYGYRFGYSALAKVVGNFGIGLLAPFKLYFDRVKKTEGRVGQTEHQRKKMDNAAYRGIYQYFKILHNINQSFLMRPAGNIGGLIFGAIGYLFGLVASILPIQPPVRKMVTESNFYFGEIYVEKKTHRFLAVLVYSGLVGAMVGLFYTAPVVLNADAVFQGSEGLAQLFSMTATFLYELPSLLKSMWDYTKKFTTFLSKSISWSVETFISLTTKIVRALEQVLSPLFNVLKDTFIYGWTKLKNALTVMGNFLSGVKNWAIGELYYAYDKVGSVVKFIKENGIRGVLSWIKDKTIGSALRYLDSLSQISRVKSEIRETVDNLLGSPEKGKALFKILNFKLDWLTLDLSTMPKLDQINLIMSHINKISEVHRANYQHGNVEVKLAYLENLKLTFKKLMSDNLSQTKTGKLLSVLDKILDKDYRSWSLNHPNTEETPVLDNVLFGLSNVGIDLGYSRPVLLSNATKKLADLVDKYEPSSNDSGVQPELDETNKKTNAKKI